VPGERVAVRLQLYRLNSFEGFTNTFSGRGTDRVGFVSQNEHFERWMEFGFVFSNHFRSSYFVGPKEWEVRFAKTDSGASPRRRRGHIKMPGC